MSLTTMLTTKLSLRLKGKNYRAWRRAIEIGLSTKRKLGFIKGTVVRSATDVNLAELWDTCNNMVICWIMGSVSESIARSIMFVGTASEIWQQLEKRFSLSDGSRKYKLNKDTYEITHFGCSIGSSEKAKRRTKVSSGIPSKPSGWKKVGYPPWHAKFKGSQQIYDTGASDHLTPVHDNMFDPYQLKIKPQIRLPTEITIMITPCSETVKVNNLEVAKDVLVVPSFKFSLLFVSKLTEDGQSVVSFYLKFCVVQDLTTRKVTRLGSMKEGLYHLVNVTHDKIDSMFSKLVQDFMQKFSLSALGNLKFENKVSKDSYVSLSKSSFDNCLSCPMAKFTKLPYSLSDSHSNNIFELIHIDIWGPYKVPTNGRFRYFLTIVDDCSRGTWVYLLEQKYDAFMALKSFTKFVATQFEKQVKIARSDNALEFVKGQPQQNGRVERKHRHILDTARALRFHLKLPLKFWGYCITTATYLLNRIPSSVIGNKTPYEVLLKKKPVYEHLRVFRCFAVVSKPSRTADKFDPRGVPFVFLGYPRKSKVFETAQTSTVVPEIQSPQFNSSDFPPLPTRKSTRTIVLPNKLKDFKDPVNFKEAILDPGWCDAMDLELKALDDNGTWELTTLLVALKGWDTCQMDVSNVFFHGDLMEEVYMKSPLGYVGKGKKVTAANSLDSTLVCKLKKSLYGLKQAPRQWFFKLSNALVEFGFTQSKTDYSLFVKKEGSSFTTVLVYVDDLLITENDQSQISKLKAQDLLKERGILNNKQYKLPMDLKLKLQVDVGTPLIGPEVYRRAIDGFKRTYKKKARNDPTMSSEYEQYLKADLDSHSISSQRVTLQLLDELGAFWKAKEKSVSFLIAAWPCDLLNVQASS
ncbi:retrovirus-related pol polyprotein from transposon TNT 1-94 [Tanacetum coccineum]